jgi:hypothetical protein
MFCSRWLLALIDKTVATYAVRQLIRSLSPSDSNGLPRRAAVKRHGNTSFEKGELCFAARSPSGVGCPATVSSNRGRDTFLFQVAEPRMADPGARH